MAPWGHGAPTFAGWVCEAAAVDLSWDPFDTDLDDDPHPTWRRLRDEAPVYRNDKYDFYALSRYADVEAAHRDPAPSARPRAPCSS